MTEDEAKDVSELLMDACYTRIKFSSLWNSLNSNGQIDKKAEDFKALLLMHLEALVEAEVIAVEREAEAAVA